MSYIPAGQLNEQKYQRQCRRIGLFADLQAGAYAAPPAKPRSVQVKSAAAVQVRASGTAGRLRADARRILNGANVRPAAAALCPTRRVISANAVLPQAARFTLPFMVI